MRKIVILVVLVLSIVACYYVSVEGIDTSFLQIASYSDVKSENKNLDTQISELNRKNTTEYQDKKTALTTAVKNYKDKKEQYEAMAPTISQDIEDKTEDKITGTTPYDIEFLWTIVGNYATEEGIDIKFTFTKSASSVTTSSDEYTMADINFDITGTYNSIIEFLYDIEEEDSRLGFEISSFKMVKSSSGVEATFVVESVPITSSNLSSFDANTTTTTTDSSTSTTDTSTSTGTTSTSSTSSTSSSTTSSSTSSTSTTATSTDSSTQATTATTTVPSTSSSASSGGITSPSVSSSVSSGTTTVPATGVSVSQ
jgi:hypothetical protein